MGKIKVHAFNATDCETASEGTDPVTEGWWFHGTDERTAKNILSGKRPIRSPFCLTKNHKGASQRHGKCVIRCTVRLKKTAHDRYFMKEKGEGLDAEFRWLEVVEGTLFLDKEYVQCDYLPKQQ